jgi:hypothetical protein
MLNIYNFYNEPSQLNNYSKNIAEIEIALNIIDYWLSISQEDAEIIKHGYIGKKSPVVASVFAVSILKERWYDAEPYIMKDPEEAYKYAYEVVKGRWPECEHILMKDPYWAYVYATYIIKNVWPEAEPYIRTNEIYWNWYQANIPSRQNYANTVKQMTQALLKWCDSK